MTEEIKALPPELEAAVLTGQITEAEAGTMAKPKPEPPNPKPEPPKPEAISKRPKPEAISKRPKPEAISKRPKPEAISKRPKPEAKAERATEIKRQLAGPMPVPERIRLEKELDTIEDPLKGLTPKPKPKVSSKPGPVVDLTRAMAKGQRKWWKKATPWKEELGETVFSAMRRMKGSVEAVSDGIMASAKGHKLAYDRVQKTYDDLLKELRLTEKVFVAPSLRIITGRGAEKSKSAGTYQPYLNQITIYVKEGDEPGKPTLLHETAHAVTTPFEKGMVPRASSSLEAMIQYELERAYFVQHVSPNSQVFYSQMRTIANDYFDLFDPGSTLDLDKKAAIFEKARAKAKVKVGYTGHDPSVLMEGEGSQEGRFLDAPDIAIDRSKSLIAKYEAMGGRKIGRQVRHPTEGIISMSKGLEPAASSRPKPEAKREISFQTEEGRVSFKARISPKLPRITPKRPRLRR